MHLQLQELNYSEFAKHRYLYFSNKKFFFVSSMNISRTTCQIGLVLILSMFIHKSAWGQCDLKPKASFTSKDGCEADSVPFTNTSQNATSYFWKFGDGNSSTLESPKYLYSYYGNTRTFTVGLYAYSDNKKCVDSYFFNVTTYGTSGDFTFTNNERKFNFTATGSWISKYHWDFGDGDSSNIAKPSHTYTDTLSSHTVCLSVTNPVTCTHQKCMKISTPNPARLSSIIKSNRFKIFPNPSQGDFSIELEFVKSENRLEINNTMGQVVYMDMLNTGTHKLDLNLPDGIYWVNLIDKNGNVLSQTLILQK